MRKLSLLVEFIIKTLNMVAAENVSSFHVYENYKPAGYAVNGVVNAVCLYDQEYSAVVQIDRFPCARYPPEMVFGLLACWLIANDPHSYRYKIERGGNGELIPLANPDINTVKDDDETMSIELIVPFREPVFGIHDENNGIYTFKGKKYRLADTTNPAEQFEDKYIINANYDQAQWRRTTTK